MTTAATTLRVVFAGTPAFASAALEAIVAAGHAVSLVLTQPDRPAGRGMHLASSDVASTAQRLGIEVAKPQTLRDEAIQARLRALDADVFVVAAYGLILPRAVLDIPAQGCLNIHASLLPRWRGAAPIQRALLAGDATTGICIMQMAEGLDTGPVLLAKSVPIQARDTTGSLTANLADVGARAIVEALAGLEALTPREQDETHATYAAKIGKPEATINWNRGATEIDRQIRAFNPAPGAEAILQGLRLKIWDAEPTFESSLAPGAVAIDPSGVRVGCADGAMRLLQVQRPGAKSLPIQEFMRGNPFTEAVK